MAREARGLTIRGASLLADGYQLHVPKGYDEPHPSLDQQISGEQARELRKGIRMRADEDAGPEIHRAPVYLSADMVNSLIAGGGLTAGCLNGLDVNPPKALWPDEWCFLKSDLDSRFRQPGGHGVALEG